MIINTSLENNKTYKKEYNGKEVDTYRFLIMDNSITRNGYKYNVNGIDLKSFKDNPVVLLNHNADNAIGAIVELERAYNKLYGYLFISNEEAKIKNKVDEGVYRAVSITVLPKNKTPYSNYTSIDKSEALEVSLVTIPNLRTSVRNSFDLTKNEVIMPNEYEELQNQIKQLENSIASKDTEIKALSNKVEGFEGNDNADEVEALKNKYTEQTEELKKLQNKFQGFDERVESLQKMQNSKPITQKDVKTYPLGDLAIADYNATRNGKTSIEYIKNKLEQKNISDFERERWTRALSNQLQVTAKDEDDLNALHNAYNLGSIVDGARLADPNNAIPLVEILRAEQSFLSMQGITRVPFINGRAAFPVQETKGTAAAFSNNGTDEPNDAESGFKDVELYVKEVAGKVAIQNFMLRHGSVEFAGFLEQLLIKDVTEKAEYLALLGSGGSSEPLGILNRTDIQSSAATGSADSATINKDIRTVVKALAQARVKNINFFMNEVTKISVETQYTTNGDLIYYANQLMNTGRLYNRQTNIVDLMPFDEDAVLLACDPSNIVLGVGNGLTVTASEHAEFKKDKTIVKGIFDLDIGLKHPNGVYQLTDVNEWEASD